MQQYADSTVNQILYAACNDFGSSSIRIITTIDYHGWHNINVWVLSSLPSP